MAAKHNDKAKVAAEKIVETFRNPENLPKALAHMALNVGSHSAGYSWSNQMLVWIEGYTDAAGYKQWVEYGRRVRKGERAFYILAPIVVKYTEKSINAETGEEVEEKRTYIKGWRGVPVFGLEQTEVEDEEKWKKRQGEAAEHVENLPWLEVARKWGLTVKGAHLPGAAGFFSHRDNVIGLGVKNLSTWAHELVHAAEEQLGNLTHGLGQDPSNEIVAELGGAVLLTIAGMEHEADLGGCWDYVKSYGEGDPIKKAMGLLKRLSEAVGFILEEIEKNGEQEAA
jgi:antirestriction protein ArdC